MGDQTRSARDLQCRLIFLHSSGLKQLKSVFDHAPAGIPVCAALLWLRWPSSAVLPTCLSRCLLLTTGVTWDACSFHGPLKHIFESQRLSSSSSIRLRTGLPRQSSPILSTSSASFSQVSCRMPALLLVLLHHVFEAQLLSSSSSIAEVAFVSSPRHVSLWSASSSQVSCRMPALFVVLLHHVFEAQLLSSSFSIAEVAFVSSPRHVSLWSASSSQVSCRMHIPLQHIFVVQLLSSMAAIPLAQFRINNNLRQTAVGHLTDMPFPTKL